MNFGKNLSKNLYNYKFDPYHFLKHPNIYNIPFYGISYNFFIVLYNKFSHVSYIFYFYISSIPKSYILITITITLLTILKNVSLLFYVSSPIIYVSKLSTHESYLFNGVNGPFKFNVLILLFILLSNFLHYFS